LRATLLRAEKLLFRHPETSSGQVAELVSAAYDIDWYRHKGDNCDMGNLNGP